MGYSNENLKGFVLALLSSVFIGASFIIKKKGLKRAAAASGVRAGVGGHSYLLEPLWWFGMITMIFGEVANFVAYAFAPAVLVTPLGALSIIVSAVLAHFILNEKLHHLGVLGCVMCIAGSVVIVVHAPQERPITSVQEIWRMATQTAAPSFSLQICSSIFLSPNLQHATITTASEPSQFYLDEKWKLSKKEGPSRSFSTSSSLMRRNSSSSSTKSSQRNRRYAFARTCTSLVKEQRARFYIMRHCVTVLICWRDCSDS